MIADELQILDLAVHPSYRRQGHGQCLLKTLLQNAKRAGCNIATLEVSKDNTAAIHLYKRFGFGTVHVRKAYYKDDSDALLLNVAIDGSTSRELPA